MFAENLAVFFDEAAGFAIACTIAGVTASVLLDAPGAEAMGGEMVTTEPSILVSAAALPEEGAAVVIQSAALPAHLVHLAGTYTVRSVMPEPPDGALHRAFLGKA